MSDIAEKLMLRRNKTRMTAFRLSENVVAICEEMAKKEGVKTTQIYQGLINYALKKLKEEDTL